MDVFADKRYVGPNCNLVNFIGLNKVLRSEVFVSEDRQLQAVHLILDFEPLSNQFQDVGQVIRVGDPRLAWIDVFVPGFLARKDLPLGELPLHRSPSEVAAPREEIASSRLSLEAEIDQFHLEEDREEQGEPIIHLSDSEDKLDRHSIAQSPQLVVACVDSNLEEEDEMPLDNKKKGLCDLLKGRGLAPRTPQDPNSLLHFPFPLLLPQLACSLSQT